MGILSVHTICNSMNSSGNCLNQGSVLNDYYGSEIKPSFSTIQMLNMYACYTRPSEFHIEFFIEHFTQKVLIFQA